MDIHFSITFGLKTTTSALGVPISNRREINPVTGELTFKSAVNGKGVLSNFEFGAIEASGLISDAIGNETVPIKGDPFGIKYDHFTHVNRGGMLGGTLNPDQLELAVRAGFGTSDTNAYISFNFGLEPHVVVPDPAGGSGSAVQSPGAGRAPGYGGRFDDGRGLRAGDELSGLDAIVEEWAFLGRPSHLGSDSVLRSKLRVGDGDHRNDNDWRIPEGDWRHSTNRTDQKIDPVTRWTTQQDEGDGSSIDTGPTENHSVRTTVVGPSGKPIYDKGVNDDNYTIVPPTRKSDPKDDHGRTREDPKYTGPQPIVLDLDGNGIRVTELSESTVFMDATGDGYVNRTAWADVGDGVLFYDPDDTGQITETRQYVFTDWDPTASSDLTVSPRSPSDLVQSRMEVF